MLYIQLAWRNLWRNRRRTLITAAAVFFAGFSVICMRMLQLGSYDNMVRNTVGSYTGFIQIHQKGYWNEKSLDNSFPYEEEIFQAISQTEGIHGASKRLTGFSLISNGNKTRGIQVEGFDPSQEYQLSLENQMVTGSPDPGNGVIIGQDLAKYLSVSIGDSLVFIGQGFHGMSANALLPVTGIAKFGSPVLNRNTAFLDLQLAQYMFAVDNRVTAFAINTKEDFEEADIAEEIQSKLDTSVFEVMTWQVMLPELVQSIEADSAGGILMAGILYLVISFSLLGTFIMLAAERRREYGMLVGLGMRRSQLIRVAALEALFLGFLGSSLAILITRPIGYYFNANPIQFTGQARDALREMGMDAAMPTSIDWSIPFTHGLILLVLTLLISSYGMVSIKRLKPVNAMRA